jgi:predicted neuraminidase
MTDAARIIPGSEAPGRSWQGIPSIAVWRGRLWATWYGGGPREPSAENHVVLASRPVDEATWRTEDIVDAPGDMRAYDPNLWVDPRGRLWHTWNQTDEGVAELFDGVGGVWARVADEDGWSDPQWLATGVAMNTPTIRDDGAWLLPSARWNQGPGEHADPRAANVFVSQDDGAHWELLGGAVVPEDERTFDEHMVVALPDGTLWMLLRTLRGLAESFSADGGRTWTLVRPSGFGPHPSSRVWFGTLADGTIVLIGNAASMTRDGIGVRTSTDGGRTWSFPFVIDGRAGLSYPDAAQDGDGLLHVVYDRDRAGDGEIDHTVLRIEAGSVSVVAGPEVVDRLRG